MLQFLFYKLVPSTWTYTGTHGEMTKHVYLFSLPKLQIKKKKNSKEMEKKAINPWANRVEVKMEKGKTEVKIFP